MRSARTERPLTGLVIAAAVLLATLVGAPLLGSTDGASPAGDSMGVDKVTVPDSQPNVFQRIS